MSQANYAILDDRAVLAVAGEDRVEFLQGLVSTDVEKAAGDRAIHAAFLTAQGKYLHDFFVVGLGETLLLDCEAGRAADLKKRLSIYRLRAKVSIEARDDLAVAALIGGSGRAALDLPDEPGAARATGDGVAFTDPRLAAVGARAIGPAESLERELGGAGLQIVPRAAYDQLRLALGLPDGSRDLVPEKSILLENGFDELHGVDWDKGCFLGQELTARTHYRGLIKKRLMPVEIEGPVPEPGTIIRAGDKEAGEMRSGGDGRGLALLRLDAVEAADAPLSAGDSRLTPRKPDWANF